MGAKPLSKKMGSYPIEVERYRPVKSKLLLGIFIGLWIGLWIGYTPYIIHQMQWL
jgi:hypothetical protein|tara:strand:- start:139 stop:303 length:165 start_codon:yes stop_codon:yes gene_type:complete